MILKLLLKIWPSLMPIFIYCLWIFVQTIIKQIIIKNAKKRLGKIINATYQDLNKSTEEFTQDQSEQKEKIRNFSLANKNFIIVLYLSFFTAIVCFLFFAVNVPKIEGGQYIPAHIERDGKITKGQIIEK
jgi:Mg2+/citrate symporter